MIFLFFFYSVFASPDFLVNFVSVKLLDCATNEAASWGGGECLSFVKCTVHYFCYFLPCSWFILLYFVCLTSSNSFTNSFIYLRSLKKRMSFWYITFFKCFLSVISLDSFNCFHSSICSQIWVLCLPPYLYIGLSIHQYPGVLAGCVCAFRCGWKWPAKARRGDPLLSAAAVCRLKRASDL